MAVAQIQIRRGTTAEWAAANPVILAAGEQGYDTTLKRFKMGDGTTAFSALEWNTLLPYPVGAVYISVVSTSPATLFGGTWAAWGAGRVPVGIDAADADFDTVEETGGSKTHTLATTEIPEHRHNMALMSGGTAGSSGLNDRAARMYGGITDAGTFFTTNTGGGGAHNNVQPYIVCYFWKRTA